MQEGWVYILYSQSRDRYYVGSTTDLKRRLREHERGKHRFSKTLGKFKLVFAQHFKSIRIARQKERKLKRWKRREYIEKIIEDGKIP
ncbi:GIY-YIG nuclease family protein [bacterium]|nr:GIY-YIG nuclease family protein [bacterium]